MHRIVLISQFSCLNSKTYPLTLKSIVSKTKVCWLLLKDQLTQIHTARERNSSAFFWRRATNVQSLEISLSCRRRDQSTREGAAEPSDHLTCELDPAVSPIGAASRVTEVHLKVLRSSSVPPRPPLSPPALLTGEVKPPNYLSAVLLRRVGSWKEHFAPDIALQGRRGLFIEL